MYGFHKISSDILGPLTSTRPGNNKYILVITDYFTKYVVTVPMSNALATTVGKALLNHWFVLFGVPDNLHTDQGTSFCNELMSELGSLLGFDKSRTSPYHPQCNGISERT